jgi:hypothetical protein
VVDEIDLGGEAMSSWDLPPSLPAVVPRVDDVRTAFLVLRLSSYLGCFLLMCRWRRSGREKVAEHSSQSRELSSCERECNAACRFRFSCRVKRLKQTIHWNGC